MWVCCTSCVFAKHGTEKRILDIFMADEALKKKSGILMKGSNSHMLHCYSRTLTVVYLHFGFALLSTLNSTQILSTIQTKNKEQQQRYGMQLIRDIRRDMRNLFQHLAICVPSEMYLLSHSKFNRLKPITRMC